MTGTDNLTGTLSEDEESQIIQGFEIFQDAVVTNNFEKGWRFPESELRNFGELIALLHSEVTEAFESYRNNEPYLWYQYNIPGFIGEPFQSLPAVRDDSGEIVLGKPQGVASELADVIIRVLDMADEYDIPLIKTLLEKHAYNLTRSYRHGGKKA